MSKLKKADYIAKYGEEAWVLESAKRNEYSKQYREANKEYFKQYRENNKEEKKEYGKQYYEDNKERFKQYQKENKERIREQRKLFREANKEHLAEQQKQYRSTQWGRANRIKLNYIRTDKEKGFSTDQMIDEDWIIKNIFGSSCIYCGESDWRKLGVDRIDNTKGHTPDNCVCACERCNKARKNNYTVEEFVLLMKKEKKNEKT